jgi:hypothetical protein
MRARPILQQISIRERLRLFFAVIILMMLLGSILAFQQLRTVSAHATDVAVTEQRASSVLRLHNAMLTLIGQLHRSAHDESADEFAANAHRLLEQFRSRSSEATSVLEEIRRGSDRHALLVGSIRSMLDSLPGRIDSFVRLAAAGDWIALNARLPIRLTRPMT